MTEEENLVLAFLKTTPTVFYSPKEIARKAGGKKRFKTNPNWAKPVLLRLADKNLLESDAVGHFRLKPQQQEKKRTKVALAPHIEEMLRRSGKDFSGTFAIEDDENTGGSK